MIARSRDYGRIRKYGYICHNHHARGASVCANWLEAPMEATHHLVLSAIETEVMRPEIIERAIQEALEARYPSDLETKRDAVLKQIRLLKDEEDRLADAIARGQGHLDALMQALKDRQGQRERYEHELTSVEAAGRVGRLDFRRAETQIRERLRDWQGVLTRQTTEGRAILQEFLVGRLIFKPIPDERQYEVYGEGTFARLLAVNNRSIALVTPAGFEPAISTLKGPARR